MTADGGTFAFWVLIVCLDYLGMYVVSLLTVFLITVVFASSRFVYWRLASIVDWVADGFIKKK
jgi:hypothetical protein